ncbi:MAG: hypothetical protein P4K92_07515 [Candidatus Nitrosotalea sp.]|nr:hypothetical protein [Candidatus Nitrosotalea sp.]
MSIGEPHLGHFISHQKQILYLEYAKQVIISKTHLDVQHTIELISKTISIIIMQTTGSCMKCGYQARPRKNQSFGTDIPTCPKCNNALT